MINMNFIAATNLASIWVTGVWEVIIEGCWQYRRYYSEQEKENRYSKKAKISRGDRWLENKMFENDKTFIWERGRGFVGPVYLLFSLSLSWSAMCCHCIAVSFIWNSIVILGSNVFLQFFNRKLKEHSDFLC